MTKTLLGQDDNWWEGIFTEAEIREIRRITERVLAEFDTSAPEVHEVYLTLPVGQLIDTIKAAFAWSKNEATTEEMQLVVGLMWLVGEALTEVYFFNDNVPPDETATAAYRYWRGIADDEPIEWDQEDDDGDEPPEGYE